MRTLPAAAVGDWILFPDTDDPGLRWAIRARPVALGEPSLVRWHAVNGPADGRLLLEVGIGPSAAEIASLCEITGATQVRALPVAGAQVRLAVEADRVVADAQAVNDSVVVGLDLPAFLAERVEALATGADAFPIKVNWEMTVWVQLPAGRVEVAADEALVGLLDGDRPPGLGASLNIAWSGSSLAPELLLDWAWAELRRRKAAGEPLSFVVVSGTLLAMPVILSASLEALGALRVQHVDLAAEAGLRQRRFEVRLAGDLTSAGWASVEVCLRLGGAPRYASLLTTVSWDVPYDPPATWSWRASPAAGAPGAWAPEQPAIGIGWVTVPTSARREVNVSAAGLDLERRWERVEVHLAGDPPVLLTLDRARPTAQGVIQGPASARVTFVAYGGAIRVTELQSVGETLIVVDPEAGDFREITVAPSGGGWAGVVVWIDVEHAEGALWRRQTIQMALAGARARVPDAVAWRWRAHVRHPDGRFERGDWRDEGGSVGVLTLSAPAGFRLQLLPIWFDAGVTKIDLVIRPTGGPEVQHQITSARPVELLLDGALPAAWEASWVRVDGTTTLQAGTAEQVVLVLPKG